MCHCLPQGKQCGPLIPALLLMNEWHSARGADAVCHCLPQGKQCGPLIPALLLPKQWHTDTASGERVAQRTGS